ERPGLLHPCHPRRPASRPGQRGRGARDLGDLHLRPGRRRRPARRLRVLALGQPDADGARAVPGLAGAGRARLRLRQRPGRRGHPAADDRPARWARRHPRRRLRRHLPDLRPGARALGARLHPGSTDRPGRRAGGRPARRDHRRLGGDAHQPAARRRRHRRDRGHRPRGRCPAGRRQHLRLALPAAAADPRGRRRRALHHEVLRRPLRRRRRRPAHLRRRPGRAAALLPERHRRRRRPVRRLARAPRAAHPGRPDGAALRQRRAGGRLPRRAPAGVGGLLPGSRLPPGPRRRDGADAPVRRDGQLPGRGRRGGRRRRVRPHGDLHPGRVPGRRGVPHRAPRPDDARLGGRDAAGGAGRPGPAQRRHRGRRRPGRRPRAGPGL
ncbi:MAG: Cystathionine gamma-lyase, partial [uncultured Friedmanniella sp.]